MLQPARTKYRLPQKGRIRGTAGRGTYVAFGEYGLQSLEGGLVSSRQIEASRVAMSRFIKKGGKIFIRIFPDRAVTKKPAETRMGKGKGQIEGYAAVVLRGRVLFELEGLDLETAKRALRLASDKLSVKTQFLTREKFR